MQYKLKGKDLMATGIEYISNLEELNDPECSDFDHDRNTAFISVN
jgi:hypothetical protein